MIRAVAASASPRRGLTLMTTAGVLWGTIGPCVAFLGDHTGAGALELSLYRAVITALVLSIAAAILRRPLRVAHGRRLRVASVGAGVAIYQSAYFAAVQEAGIGVATLIALGLGPVLVATGEAVLARHLQSLAVLGALAASLAGLCMLVAGADNAAAAGSVGLGAALAVVSATGYAAVVLASRMLAGEVSALTLNTGSSLAAACVLAPVAVGGVTGPQD